MAMALNDAFSVGAVPADQGSNIVVSLLTQGLLKPEFAVLNPKTQATPFNIEFELTCVRQRQI